MVASSGSGADIVSASNSVVAVLVLGVVRASRSNSSGGIANVFSAFDVVVAQLVVGDDNASSGGRAEVSSAVGEVVTSFEDRLEDASHLGNRARVQSAVDSVIAKRVHLGVDASVNSAFVESARNMVVADVVVEGRNAALVFD